MKVRSLSRIVLGVAGVCLGLAALGSPAWARTFQDQQAQAQQNLMPPTPLSDGTYLYGEAPQPNQIGKGYALFRHHQGTVVGALYYPRSEFDCFKGSIQANTLDIQSMGAYDSAVVALEINLADLYPIQQISANDQRLLAVCQQTTAVHSNPSPFNRR